MGSFFIVHRRQTCTFKSQCINVLEFSTTSINKQQKARDKSNCLSAAKLQNLIFNQPDFSFICVMERWLPNKQRATGVYMWLTCVHKGQDGKFIPTSPEAAYQFPITNSDTAGQTDAAQR